jgi:hypothetical protein
MTTLIHLLDEHGCELDYGGYVPVEPRENTGPSKDNLPLVARFPPCRDNCVVTHYRADVDGREGEVTEITPRLHLHSGTVAVIYLAAPE